MHQAMEKGEKDDKDKGGNSNSNYSGSDGSERCSCDSGGRGEPNKQSVQF
jgi:hypothetical protein